MPRLPVALLLPWLVAHPAAGAAPRISILAFPPYGSDGVLAGTVTGADPGEHAVAAFAHIEGAGWWTKPTEARPEDVFVDEAGRLHLFVRWREGVWWASEAILLESLGHGRYCVRIESDLAELHPNVTVGSFVFDVFADDESAPDNPQRELDFEESRWLNHLVVGNPEPTPPPDGTLAHVVISDFEYLAEPRGPAAWLAALAALAACRRLRPRHGDPPPPRDRPDR